MMQSRRSETKPRFEFEAIGTKWSIDGKISDSLKNKIADRIAKFDHNYSRFRDSSFMRSISQKRGKYTLPKDAKKLFDFYQELYKYSDGLVTPLIGKTMQQAGYDETYSFAKGKLTQPPSWEDALDYDFPNLNIKEPVIFDFGAAGKGYIVDLIGKLLSENGVKDFCINAGGDILVRGLLQKIGLENPNNTNEIIGTINIAGGALCASSGNRRKWADLHHTINPYTLESPKNIQAIWVKAKTTMIADGLATALYFVEPVKMLEHFKFEYAIMKNDSLEYSEGFGAVFF